MDEKDKEDNRSFAFYPFNNYKTNYNIGIKYHLSIPEQQPLDAIYSAIMLGVLDKRGYEFKVVKPKHYDYFKSDEEQKGKFFTIYPRSKAEEQQIRKTFEKIIDNIEKFSKVKFIPFGKYEPVVRDGLGHRFCSFDGSTIEIVMKYDETGMPHRHICSYDILKRNKRLQEIILKAYSRTDPNYEIIECKQILKKP